MIGNEGEGVGRLVKETCDIYRSHSDEGGYRFPECICGSRCPAYEIVRQRMHKNEKDCHKQISIE